MKQNTKETQQNYNKRNKSSLVYSFTMKGWSDELRFYNIFLS